MNRRIEEFSVKSNPAKYDGDVKLDPKTG